MAIEQITQAPTKLVIHPDSANIENTGYSARSSDAATESQVSASNGTGSAEADYSFWDFLDLINPLQHIPVVNTIYRAVTGDTIKPEIKLAGSAVLGGPLGFVAGLADVIFEQETGKDIGNTMMASVFGPDEEAPVQTAALQNDPNGPLPVQNMEDITASLQPMAPLPQALPKITGAKQDERDEREQRLAMIDPMDQSVLDLYGKSSPTIAAKAYQQADMRNYLQQASVNTSY